MNRQSTWMQTYTGRKFVFTLDPIDPSTLHLQDIVHSLSRLCRFNGHVKGFCSVAKHSMTVHGYLYIRYRVDYFTAVLGLFHDSEEAYVPDLASPLSHFLQPESDAFDTLKRHIRKAIYQKYFNTTPTTEQWKLIKEADNWALFQEKKHGVDNGVPLVWSLAKEPPPHHLDDTIRTQDYSVEDTEHTLYSLLEMIATSSAVPNELREVWSSELKDRSL